MVWTALCVQCGYSDILACICFDSERNVQAKYRMKRMQNRQSLNAITKTSARKRMLKKRRTPHAGSTLGLQVRSSRKTDTIKQTVIQVQPYTPELAHSTQTSSNNTPLSLSRDGSSPSPGSTPYTAEGPITRRPRPVLRSSTFDAQLHSKTQKLTLFGDLSNDEGRANSHSESKSKSRSRQSNGGRVETPGSARASVATTATVNSSTGTPTRWTNSSKPDFERLGDVKVGQQDVPLHKQVRSAKTQARAGKQRMSLRRRLLFDQQQQRRKQRLVSREARERKFGATHSTSGASQRYSTDSGTSEMTIQRRVRRLVRSSPFRQVHTIVVWWESSKQSSGIYACCVVSVCVCCA